MWSSRFSRRIALVAGAAAIAGMGLLTACSTDTKEKPTETQAPSSASQAPAPTEKKSVGSFTPSVKAPPAPTALPGNVITGGN